MALRDSKRENMGRAWRSLEQGEEVIVTSEGRYPRLDFKVGVTTGGYELKKGGNNRYEVYFPELDKTYWILLTYLTPLKGTTEAQKERYFQRARQTLMKKTLEFKGKKKEGDRLSKQVMDLWKEYEALPQEEKEKLHQAVVNYPEDIKNILASEGPEESHRLWQLLRDLDEVKGSPWPTKEEWEPYKAKEEEYEESRKEFSALREELGKKFKEAEIEDYWKEEGSLDV